MALHTAKSDAERDKRSMQAAFLRARHNFSQEEIGHVLGDLSQSYVSRLLSRAVEMGWLVTEMHFNERDISPELMQELRELTEPKRLSDLFKQVAGRTGSAMPNVRVFDSGSEASTAGAFDLRCRRFGKTAAGRIDELLRRSRAVGVTWGRTVSALIDGLVAAHRSYNLKEPITFAPVSAELIQLASPEYSSSLLAERLSNLVNGSSGERLRITGIPAYIPRRYDLQKSKAIREYLLDSASYRRIFSGDDPLVNQLDTLITSVGSSERPLGGAFGEVLTAGDISADELKSIIDGDIGGILVDRPGISADQQSKLNELNAMWTGITMANLNHIARRARQTGGVGVVAVAIGRERAGVIKELIRKEVLNELIIDWDLANSLERLMT